MRLRKPKTIARICSMCGYAYEFDLKGWECLGGVKLYHKDPTTGKRCGIMMQPPKLKLYENEEIGA